MKFLAIVSAAPILSFAQSIIYSKDHTLDVKGLQISQSPTQKNITYEIIPTITDILIVNGTVGGYNKYQNTNQLSPPTNAKGDNIITYDGAKIQQVEGDNTVALSAGVLLNSDNGDRDVLRNIQGGVGLKNVGKWNKTHVENKAEPDVSHSAVLHSFDKNDRPNVVEDGVLGLRIAQVTQGITVAPGTLGLSSSGIGQGQFQVDRDHAQIVDYQMQAANTNVVDGGNVALGRARTNNLRVNYDEGPLKVDTNDGVNINAQLSATDIPLLKAIAETETGAVVKALALMWADALLNQDLLV